MPVFDFAAAPHIKDNRIFLVNFGWYGALPVIVRDTPDNRNQYNWTRAPYEKVGDYLYVNGGTPIMGDVAEHLRLLESHISAAVAPEFDGFIVLDFESWWPQWDWPSHAHPLFDNGPSYRDIAVNQVRMARPDLTTDREIVAEAKKLWEERGLALYLETQKTIRRVRPAAKVAWYDAMFRSYHQDYLTPEGDSLRALNDKLLSIHQDSDFVIADIYQFYSSAENSARSPLSRPAGGWVAPPNSTVWFEDNRRYVEGNIREAQRLARLAGGKPIMTYSWHRYHDSANDRDRYQLLHRGDIFLETVYPLMLGVNSVTIWGNEISSYSNTGHGTLQSYLDSTMGPMIEAYCRGDASLYSDIIELLPH